jgi:hypothetical protein
MFSYSNASVNKVEGMSFDYLVSCPDSINILYRGLSQQGKIKILFEMPFIIGGQFGTLFPSQLKIADVKTHKETSLLNTSGGQHLVSMSTEEGIGKSFGYEDYMIIDPSLFREFIVDIDESYKRNGLNYSSMMGKMLSEKEYAAPIVLSCSIQSVVLNGIKIANPFYLPIVATDSVTREAFKSLYISYIDFLRKKYAGVLTKIEEERCLVQFVESYIAFYDRYANGNNPFTMSIIELQQNYPAFMKEFSDNPANSALFFVNSTYQTNVFSERLTLKQLVFRVSPSILNEHAYLKHITPTLQVTLMRDDYYNYQSYD